MPAAISLRLDRPVILDPAGFIDVVNIEIAEATTARPQKAMEILDLIEKLVASLGSVSTTTSQESRSAPAPRTRPSSASSSASFSASSMACRRSMSNWVFRFIEVIRFIIHRACRERFLVHEFIGDMDELHLVTQSLDVLDQVASD